MTYMHQQVLPSYSSTTGGNYNVMLPLHVKANHTTTVLEVTDQDKLEFRALSIQVALEKDLPHLTQIFTKHQYRSNSDQNDTMIEAMTPQERALHWLLYEDTSTSPDRKDLYQRYIVTVLFFATTNNHKKEWKHGDLHFLSSLHECHWYKSIHRTKHLGIHSCNSDMQITNIFLPEMNLHGAIPEELGYLNPVITNLDLQNNHLHGTIPITLGRLTNLKSLTLNHNSLNGTIPTHLGQLTQLRTYHHFIMQCNIFFFLCLKFDQSLSDTYNLCFEFLTAENLLLHFNDIHGPDNTVSTKYFPPKIGTNMWTDCARNVDPIVCQACTVCCDGLSNCQPRESE